MRHSTNIQQFLAAAKSGPPLLGIYCALIAIELAIKKEAGLKDHNLCSGLNRLKALKAIGNKSWVANNFTGLVERLKSDLKAIAVNDKFGLPTKMPHESYPYIRYARMACDQWPAPHVTDVELNALLQTVQQIRVFLKMHFSIDL